MVRDRQHRAVRAELTRRLGQRGLQLTQALLAHGGDRLGRRTAQGLLGGQPVLGVDHGHDDRGARLQLVAEAMLDAALHLVPGEPAGQGTGRPADHDGGQHRRREQADDQADAAAPPQALAAQMVTRLSDADLAAEVALGQDHAFRPDRPVLHQPYQRIEVALGRLGGLVSRHDHVEGVTHGSILSEQSGTVLTCLRVIPAARYSRLRSTARSRACARDATPSLW